jgi:hypothetical protein
MQSSTENYTNSPKIKENKLLACCWFALAALLALTPIISLSGKAYFLTPGIIGLSVILLMMGRQRLNKYRIQEEKFRIYTRNIAFFVAIYCSVSIVLMNNA